MRYSLVDWIVPNCAAKIERELQKIKRLEVNVNIEF